MKLPNNEIGISDILGYRDCPQEFAWGMRRHVDLPERFALYEGEKDVPPEQVNENSAYGSCIHDCIAVVETERVSDEDAVARVWPRYQHWLFPEDLDRLAADLATFHTREELGVRLIAAEEDMRVPLFVHKGEQIYFRFKVDRLVQRLDNEGVFLSRDYKSSRHRKSEAEVHADLQQWSYNWGLHERFPEIETLIQVYDQLRFGEVPIRKSPEQRRQIRAWLIRQVTAILEDETLAPQQNEWCAYCPLVADCRVTHLATDFWRSRLAALAPEEKEGRKIKTRLDPARSLGEYAEVLREAQPVMRQLKRFEEVVKEALSQLPDADLGDLGWGRSTRTDQRFSAPALRRIAAEMGEDFWFVAGVTKSKLESFYGKDAPEIERFLELAEREEGPTSLRAR